MEQLAIEAGELSRRYGNRWSLARLNLQVKIGERFLIVGGNGSGKTTLLRLLSTALPRSGGSLSIFGRDPEANRFEVRSSLGLLSHQSSIWEDLSGSENLEILARLVGVNIDTGALLSKVKLESRPEPVRTYSAGMRKRLAFARLLIQRPRLTLIDEPYGQLDPEGFDLVDSLVDELIDGGSTVVMASHLVERAAKKCDRALLLESGQERWTGASADVPKAWRALHRVEL